MHDDREIVESRLRHVTDRYIRPAVRSARHPLTVEAWEVPGEPVPVDDALNATYEPFTIGSMYGRPWGTTWFRMSGDVPADWAGRRVETVIDLGFSNSPGFQSEGMLWGERGGAWQPLRGLHPLNHDVDVADPVRGGESVSYFVEAASNPRIAVPDPNSDITTARTEPIYALTAAHLVVVEVDVYELREDIRCLSQLMNQLHTDDPRRHEILRALERMLDALVLADIAGTAGKAREQLTEVLSRPATASAHKISAIGHAHIDSAWLWPVRETKRKCARTFSNVLHLMDDYPELLFGCSQAAQYEWMKDGYPGVFDGIKKRVADGRWIPIGGMWVEPDVNLPSGESLVRQFVHGQRFFDEHFGVRCTETWIPDVFGYTAALPQIMRLAGVNRFLTQKLSWNKTNKFPHHTFLWEGIDGSTVFTHFPSIDTYNALMSPQALVHATRNFLDKGHANRSLMPFGFGDGGGGPNRQMLQQFRRVRDLEGLPRVEMESPSDFFDKAIDDYPDAPRWVGELYFETHRGTYTSQARTKQGNRLCERLLHEAELWCTAAYGTTESAGYPRAELDRIWKTVLFHQFHDILPGSSIGWVHREAEETYAALETQLNEIIDEALVKLGAGVANSAPVDRDEIVLTPDGPVRVVAPALGLGSVTSAEGLSPVVIAQDGDLVTMTNGKLFVSIDSDGHLVVCDRMDMPQMRPTLAGRANVLQIHPDNPVEYDAWDLDAAYRTQMEEITAVDSIEAFVHNNVAGQVVVKRSFGTSTITQTYELTSTSPRLDIHTEIDWYEREHVLKASFPLDVHTEDLTRDIQFGHIATKIHTNTSWDEARFEVCAHRWVDAAEPGFGVALLNNGKYGHDATRIRTADDRPATNVRLTLLKGARFPDPHGDEGKHAFTYSLMPHLGDFREAGVIAEGYRLNRPVRVTGIETVGASSSMVSSTDPACIVETVKPADDDSGDLIVRVYEAFGGRAWMRLHFAFEPSSVQVVDLLEEKNDAIPAVAIHRDGTKLTGELRPFQILTLRISR